MYAIVKTGGKQYRVEPGQRLLVERLGAEVGSTVTLEPLLYRSDEIVTDKGTLASVKVSAEVIAHERGEKVRIFKYKPKRGYKRRAGHRQELTRIEVRDISASGKGAAAKKQTASAEAKKPAAEATPAAEPKPEAEAGRAAAAEKPASGDAPKPKPAASRARKSKEDENGA